MSTTPADASLHASPVGLIGLGLVGQALAERLRQPGRHCLGWDVSPEARETFQRAGHGVAVDVNRLLAQVHTLVLAVYDTQGVTDIAQQIAACPQRRTPLTLIDCSTGDPKQLRVVAGQMKALGVEFLEAPLSGSSAQIAGGEATMILGGETDVIQAQQPVLEALSPRRIHVGGVGMGCAAKLASNLVLGLNRAAFAEGLVLARRLGLDDHRFLELILDSPARSEAAAVKGRQMIEQDFAPRSRIRQHLKDVEIMLQMARGQALPLTLTHRALLAAAVQAGDGELDNAALVRQIERMRHEAGPPQA